MKRSLWIRIVFLVIAAMFLFSGAQYFFTTAPAIAEKGEDNEVGRYQISSWAAHSGGATHHSGYYILDTVTGKVVDSKAEVHSSRE